MSETNGSAPAGDEATGAANSAHAPHIQILRGHPTAAEVAALITVLGSAGGGAAPEQPEKTRWGLPVDNLRYAISNYQRITLQERIHMQR
ncbi:hypothetical protein BN1232_01400 [Mycobacterium lentiflavum]|uniref:Acyl-CoA carboxylase subunit epsilon n=1 Tax=Mycobacterium lentiflavum TaxID=141349 RepID=A0A0E4GZ36_MYCLN|nr:acyl-CoA carboxylase subunit epsilon [Mycobacterium lentiflavum]CQD07853.1 hypothetical protein BN1232_01400 [Mycobacterium lentiflavum]